MARYGQYIQNPWSFQVVTTTTLSFVSPEQSTTNWMADEEGVCILYSVLDGRPQVQDLMADNCQGLSEESPHERRSKIKG